MAANPRLQRLEVEGCYQLTDHFLTLVRRLLPASLNALNVRLCPNLSAAALLELVAETGVRSLHVMSTLPSDDETTAFVRQAKQLKPQLTVYY